MIFLRKTKCKGASLSKKEKKNKELKRWEEKSDKFMIFPIAITNHKDDRGENSDVVVLRSNPLLWVKNDYC